MSRLADLDAVTFDANGTLVRLRDPVPKLVRVLRERGVGREGASVRRAFEAEVRYYKRRSLRGRDRASLKALRRECAAIFLAQLEAKVDPAEFAAAYGGALRFDVLPGVHNALSRLVARGFRLAVIANWDSGLAERLAELGLAEYFTTIVSSAAAAAAKPRPAIFELALEDLGTRPERALHIGDSLADEAGARAAGMQFAWAPIPAALEAWR
jgi:2-haloalkanoic acid dehalogenase type II